MTKDLLIIFTRNPELGKVKTRLASKIGDISALNIYKFLLEHTLSITKDLKADKQVFYSEEIQKKDLWDSNIYSKKLQEGNLLGERMLHAFQQGFNDGYEHIIIIGSDMYNLSTPDLENAFTKLNDHDFVIGPAKDGGYYLLGMKRFTSELFKNKNWGSNTVLKETLKDLKNESVTLLPLRNDVDYFEDIQHIEVFQQFLILLNQPMKHYIKESADYLIQRGFKAPEIGIILGTGLGKLVEEIDIESEVSYNHIPNFPTATVEFHKGKLIYGSLSGKKVIVMQGRFHVYEGYTLMDVTFPVRVMHQLGISTLLVSNAAGAINKNFKKGEIMIIDDHINLQGGSPLAFKGVEQMGERFVDMSAPYDPDVIRIIENIAEEQHIKIHKGVYASVVGPQLETRAEYRYLGIIGADAVGMSTIPEVIVANHLKIKVSALSVLTDECDPDNLKPVNIDEILAMAGKAEPDMIAIYTELIKRL